MSDINVFDTDAHSIEVRGSWDEWSSGHTMDLDGNYYELELDITGAPGQVMGGVLKRILITSGVIMVGR